ncbi:MAG: hypothetical protein KDD60_07150, partial [Bdellovibrionales bacterium]|nr:hypothetical protein [Bdellovibrionales bacterium]
MMNTTSQHLDIKKAVLHTLGLGIFAALFFWGRTIPLPQNLGLNATVFCLLFLWITYHYNKSSIHRYSQSWIWGIPIVLTTLSFSLYENPFIRLTNFLFLPAALGFSCIVTRTKDDSLVFGSFLSQ